MGQSGNPAKRGGTSQGVDAEHTGKAVAIYHVMWASDRFDDVAEELFRLVRDTAAANPGKGRHVYLDIEGHRNAESGFDLDAYEFQIHFMLGFMMPWLTEVHMPLGDFRNEAQREDIPESLGIVEAVAATERAAHLSQASRVHESEIFDGETLEWVSADGSRRRA